MPGFASTAPRRCPSIEPTHRRRWCEVEHTRDLPPAVSLLDYCDRTLAQVLRVALCHGIPPLPLQAYPNPICAPDGIPPWPIRFTSSKNRSKLQGRILVNEIWALASDTPNVTSVAARVAERPETIETCWDRKETCLLSKPRHSRTLRGVRRQYAFGQFLKARTQWLQCTRRTGSPLEDGSSCVEQEANRLTGGSSRAPQGL